MTSRAYGAVRRMEVWWGLSGRVRWKVERKMRGSVCVCERSGRICEDEGRWVKGSKLKQWGRKEGGGGASHNGKPGLGEEWEAAGGVGGTCHNDEPGRLGCGERGGGERTRVWRDQPQWQAEPRWRSREQVKDGQNLPQWEAGELARNSERSYLWPLPRAGGA